MKKVFPDRPIVELQNAEPIFHTVFDLDDRYQVPGMQYVYSHRVYEKDGTSPRWRASTTTAAGSWWPSATTWI